MACTNSQEELDREGLTEVVPRWRYRPQGGGNRPGITSKRALLGKRGGEEEEEESWLPPEREATDEEKKRMFAMATIAGVMGVMNNHVYRFNKQTRKQNDGGSIGNQLTGEVADVVMAWWTGEFLSLAAKASQGLMQKFMIDSGLYIDDDNLFFFVLPCGTRWNPETKKLTIEEGEIEDDNQLPGDVRTMREMVKMANSVCPIIQMTSECPGKFEDKKMPLLDLKIWVMKEEERQKILFEFYRKPMATRALILARSAMPSRIKRASLTQEALRILKNCSSDIPWKRKAEYLSDFCMDICPE